MKDKAHVRKKCLSYSHGGFIEALDKAHLTRHTSVTSMEILQGCLIKLIYCLICQFKIPQLQIWKFCMGIR